MRDFPNFMFPGVYSYLDGKDISRCACVAKEWDEWAKKEPFASKVREKTRDKVSSTTYTISAL